MLYNHFTTHGAKAKMMFMWCKRICMVLSQTTSCIVLFLLSGTTTQSHCSEPAGLIFCEVPGQHELSSAFETQHGKTWRFSTNEGEKSRHLYPKNGTPWDLRQFRSLCVHALREKSGATVVRLRWMLRSKLGGAYLSTTPLVVPIGHSATVTADFIPSATNLVPTGHQRPWDELAATEIIEIELRAECNGGNSAEGQINLLLSQVGFEKPNGAHQSAPLLLDFAVYPPPPTYRARTELRFRMDPMPNDPYGLTPDSDVRITLSDGSQALAFLDQDFTTKLEGSATRFMAVGRPYWRAFLPESSSHGSLVVSAGGHHWKVPTLPPVTPRFKLELSREGKDDMTVRPNPRWNVPLEIQAAKVTTRDTGAITWSLSKGGKWNFKSGGFPKDIHSFWRPIPFWNAQWGDYGGSARPDCILARQMDELLSQAAALGECRPLIILDGYCLEPTGMFNWGCHPLKGSLHVPGNVFRSASGLEFCRRWMRYCIARWGLSKAVSSLWITTNINTPGISEFHASLAAALVGFPYDRSLPVIALNPWANAPKPVSILGSFETDKNGSIRWQVDPRSSLSGNILKGAGVDGSACFEIKAINPSATKISMIRNNNSPLTGWTQPAPDDFAQADALMFDIGLLSTAPPDLRVGVHLRDRDGLWFETLLPSLARSGDWTTYTLDITGQNLQKLSPVKHYKQWSDYSRQRISEIGIHIFSTHANWTPVAGSTETAPLSARIDNIRAIRMESVQTSKPTVTITLVKSPDSQSSTSPPSYYLGDMWQCHIKVSKTFMNPFDVQQCDLAAVITTPTGKTVRVPAFFDQFCERHEKTPGGAETVESIGDEFFTVRYRAVDPGPHRVTFELREGGRFEIARKNWQADQRFCPDGKAQAATGGHWPQTTYPMKHSNGRRQIESIQFIQGSVTAGLRLEEPAFMVAQQSNPTKKPFRGFIRAAEDKRHFRYDDGTFFYPIGPCLRSPSDNRIPYPSDKWDLNAIKRIAERGTYQYDEYFEEFQKADINWARIWMCSWWCALEWRRDWPGYQGLGRYNLLNAWRMDHILEVAENKGIAINLCLNNHGQYALDIDHEWENNPYNARLGGPLIAASEFFTSATAKIAMQNRLRYIVARYGHSPSIMAWSLCSELEFTEEYEQCVKNDSKNAPNIDQWHREMSAFLRANDLNTHLITTHFSHPNRGESTFQLPEIEIATSNAYSAFEELNEKRAFDAKAFDASAALSAFWSGNQDIRGFHIYDKPALVEEQGRHWMGGDKGHAHNTKIQLDADLHAGLWGSMVQPLGGATGYWWWLHLHFDKGYSDYKALARFMHGEDMRPAAGETEFEPVFRRIEPFSGTLLGRALKSNRRVYAWIYHCKTPLGEATPDIIGGTIRISGLNPGRYKIEFWDTYTGEISEKREVTIPVDGVQSKPLLLELPVVKRDLAIKIKAYER